MSRWNCSSEQKNIPQPESIGSGQDETLRGNRNKAEKCMNPTLISNSEYSHQHFAVGTQVVGPGQEAASCHSLELAHCTEHVILLAGPAAAVVVAPSAVERLLFQHSNPVDSPIHFAVPTTVLLVLSSPHYQHWSAPCSQLAVA